jgi:hypothetical protein
LRRLVVILCLCALAAIIACGTVESADPVDAGSSPAEPDAMPASCGNGVRDPGENCEGNDLGTDTCERLGFPGGTLSCTSACDLDSSACMVPLSCGNGAIDGDDQCEDGNLSGATCLSLGYISGDLRCGGGCRYDVSGCSNCGNDTIDPGEVCDRENLGTATCASVGSFSGGRLACDACDAFDTSGCTGAPTVPKLRLPQNNAYLGSSRTTGTRKPLFAWTASTLEGDAGIRYELQYDTSPSFSASPVVVTSTVTNHQVAQDLSVSTLPPVGTRYYWRVRACAGNACSAYSTTWWVNVGRSDRDFNGDGFSDIWIAAPQYDTRTKSDVGRVLVYLGGPTVNVSQPSHQFVGEAANDLLGGDYNEVDDGLTYAGDLNGDGYSDVVFGAGGFDGNGAAAGRFYVHYGANPPNYVADLVVDGPAADERWGQALSGGGDINADGFDDLVVNSLPTVGGYLRPQAKIFRGGATGLSATVADSVSLLGKGEIAGDVNGDGFADVLIGSSYQGGESEAPGAIFLGTADFLGDQGTGALYGTVTPVDDVNADGFSDWAVRSASCFDGCSYVVSLALGSPAPESPTNLTLIPSSGLVTRDICGAGDFGAGGANDVVVSRIDPPAGFVLFRGEPPLDAVFDASFPIGTSSADCSDAGDVNGDGRTDLLASTASSGVAFVYLYFGGSDTTADYTFSGESGDGFGRVVE